MEEIVYNSIIITFCNKSKEEIDFIYGKAVNIFNEMITDTIWDGLITTFMIVCNHSKNDSLFSGNLSSKKEDFFVWLKNGKIATSVKKNNINIPVESNKLTG